MKKHIALALAVVAAVVLPAVCATAQTLTLSGGTIEGALTNQEMIDSISSANDGRISTWVVNDPGLDPNGYMFIYQTVNQGPAFIDQVELGQYNSSVILSSGTYSNVVDLTLTGAINPASTDGDFLFFQAGTDNPTFEVGDLSNITPANVSYFLVLYTDISSFSNDTAYNEDHFAASGNIFSPVPEPPSSLVLLGGLACLFVFVKCRRRAQI